MQSKLHGSEPKKAGKKAEKQQEPKVKAPKQPKEEKDDEPAAPALPKAKDPLDALPAGWDAIICLPIAIVSLQWEIVVYVNNAVRVLTYLLLLSCQSIQHGRLQEILFKQWRREISSLLLGEVWQGELLNLDVWIQVRL